MGWIKQAAPNKFVDYLLQIVLFPELVSVAEAVNLTYNKLTLWNERLIFVQQDKKYSKFYGT
jgi:hypothetical protein